MIDISPHQQGEGFEHMSMKKFSERTRAFVKIEDGCERYCSYCIIPKARGPVRSKPLTDLREELHNLARASYQEVVLVGVNLSCYGAELDVYKRQHLGQSPLQSSLHTIKVGSSRRISEVASSAKSSSPSGTTINSSLSSRFRDKTTVWANFI